MYFLYSLAEDWNAGATLAKPPTGEGSNYVTACQGRMNGRLLVWSLSIVCIVAAFPLGEAQEPDLPKGVTPIVGDVVYEGGTFTITDHLVVPAGSTLTFRNAHVFLDAPVFCPTRGSAGYCQPSILAAGGTVRILHSVVESRHYDAHEPESGWTLSGVEAVFEIRHSTLTGYKGIGNQLPGAAPSLVEHNAFVHARGGVNFVRGAVAHVANNTFHDLWMGVSFHDSESVLVDNVFRDLGRDFGAGLFGRAIDVQSTLVGEKQFRALTRVERNLVENATQAMLNLNGFPNLVRHNVFRDNGIGLTIGVPMGDDILHSEAPIVEGNLFDDNRDALGFYTSGVARTPDYRVAITATLRGNSFVGTDCIEIGVARLGPAVTLTIDARQNWWGTSDGPQDHGPDCPALSGPGIVVDPWLTSAP